MWHATHAKTGNSIETATTDEAMSWMLKTDGLQPSTSIQWADKTEKPKHEHYEIFRYDPKTGEEIAVGILKWI